MALAVREAVKQGMAESQNALVERAVVEYLTERRREKLYAAYARAAADPAFVSDMEAVSEDFDGATPDGLDL